MKFSPWNCWSVDKVEECYLSLPPVFPKPAKTLNSDTKWLHLIVGPPCLLIIAPPKTQILLVLLGINGNRRSLPIYWYRNHKDWNFQSLIGSLILKVHTIKEMGPFKMFENLLQEYTKHTIPSKCKNNNIMIIRNTSFGHSIHFFS